MEKLFIQFVHLRFFSSLLHMVKYFIESETPYRGILLLVRMHSCSSFLQKIWSSLGKLMLGHSVQQLHQKVVILKAAFFSDGYDLNFLCCPQPPTPHHYVSRKWISRESPGFPPWKINFCSSENWLGVQFSFPFSSQQIASGMPPLSSPPCLCPSVPLPQSNSLPNLFPLSRCLWNALSQPPSPSLSLSLSTLFKTEKLTSHNLLFH